MHACGQPLDEVLCSKGTDHKAKWHLRWVTIAVPALAAGDATHLDKIKDAGRHTSATACAVAATRRSMQQSCKQPMRYAHFAHIQHHVRSPTMNSFHCADLPAPLSRVRHLPNGNFQHELIDERL